MNANASKLGRRTAPSLKKLFAVMAGFLGVSVVLAELASATTNSQPAISQTQTAASNVAAPSVEAETTPVPQQETVSEPASIKSPDSLTYGVNEVVKMYR